MSGFFGFGTKLADPYIFMAHCKWDSQMGSQRAHIILPQELIEEIDSVVGPRGRSAFLVETARAELRRRRLLTFLRDDQPAWVESDHPELSARIWSVGKANSFGGRKAHPGGKGA